MKFFFYKKDKEHQRNKVLDNFHANLSEGLLNKDICVTIKDLKISPSDKQRAYLRGVICGMALKAIQELGNDGVTNQSVYELLKERGGFYKDITVKIKDKEVIKKHYESFSNKGNKKRMIEFIEFSIRWCAEWLNIIIPEPTNYGIEDKNGIDSNNNRYYNGN